MSNLPDGVTSLSGLEVRPRNSTTIAQTATTSTAYLHVTGDIECTDDLIVGDDATITGKLEVTETSTLTGAVGVTGALTVTGALNANGALNVGVGMTGDVTNIGGTTTVYTMLATDMIVLVPQHNATQTIMIPTALATAGNIFHVLSELGATTAVVVDVAGGTIGGQAAGTGVTLMDDGAITVVSDGTNWHVIGRRG